MAMRDRSQVKQIEAALRHPLRQRILQAVEADEAITAAELAELLDQPLARVQYHLGVLYAAGESWDRQAT